MIDQVSMDATKVWMPPAHVIMGLGNGHNLARAAV